MRVMGDGTVADPIEAPGLQTFSGVIAATVIATGGRSAENVEPVAITTTGIAIATGVAAGSHS